MKKNLILINVILIALVSCGSVQKTDNCDKCISQYVLCKKYYKSCIDDLEACKEDMKKEAYFLEEIEKHKKKQSLIYRLQGTAAGIVLTGILVLILLL